MPRSTPDYAPFRAFLSAPYPLPAFIRQTQPALSAPLFTSCDTIGPSATVASNPFPYDAEWRDRPPALAPVPYPERTAQDELEFQARKQRRAQRKRDRRIARTLDKQSLGTQAFGRGAVSLHALTTFDHLFRAEAASFVTPQSPAIEHGSMSVPSGDLCRSEPEWSPTSTLLATPDGTIDTDISQILIGLCTDQEKQALEALEALNSDTRVPRTTHARLLSRFGQVRGHEQNVLEVSRESTMVLISPDTHRRLREVLGLPQTSEPYYSPMAIDPRSSDGHVASWPHPLPVRETVSAPLSFLAHAAGLSRARRLDPVSNSTRGIVLPSAPPTRDLFLPAAKACHHLLLARRVEAFQKKAVKDHNLAILALAQRTGRKLAFLPELPDAARAPAIASHTTPTTALNVDTGLAQRMYVSRQGPQEGTAPQSNVKRRRDMSAEPVCKRTRGKTVV